MAATVEHGVRRVPPAIAIVFLGVLAAIQGAAPNVSSTALVEASRSLAMIGGWLALAASVQTVAIAASVVSTGLLADRLGRRRVLAGALLVTVAGNLIVSVAPSDLLYLLGQAITGVGIGAVYSAAFAYIRVVAEPDRLGGAVGLFTAVVSLGTLVLTFVGGGLSSLDWRFAFLVLPAVSVACLVLVPVLLPAEPRAANPKRDYAGQALLVVGILVFMYGISQLAHSLTAPRTLGSIGAGLLLLVAFAWHESRTREPFFPIGLFRSPVFLAAILAGLVYNLGTAVAFLQVTNLWQYVNGLKTLEVATWQLPLIGTGIVVALVVGRLTTRGLSLRIVLLAGGAMTGVGFGLLAAFHASTGLLGFLPGLVLVGGGVIMCAIPFGSLFLQVAPSGFYGPVTSARTSVGQLFYAIGFALATVAVNRLTYGGTTAKLEAAGVPPQQIGTGLDAVTAYATRSTAPDTSVGKAALADAVASYGDAFATVMVITGVVCAVAAILGAVLLGRAAPKPSA